MPTNRKPVAALAGAFLAAAVFGAPSAAGKKTEEGQGRGGVRVTRIHAVVAPLLEQAYAHYLRGDYAAAGDAYRRLLAAEPENSDALHGLAAVLLRQDDEAGAAGYYRQALDADPTDTLAQAWLIGRQGAIDPARAESRLKAILATQPDFFPANAVLGNLYAAQNRWREAQAAYLRACSVEPDDPDILFNLAVSHDRLRETETARRYYALAIEAAGRRPAGFDRARVAARLEAIRP